MSAFELLPARIQKFIYDKGFVRETAIEEAAIPRIMEGEKNVVLVSGTAEGKTEAVILPVAALADFGTPGVKVLYISPLVTLINDQNGRFEELLTGYLGESVVKWHGEAKRSAKMALVENPGGCVLMTPESLEGMFQNHPEQIPLLFGRLQFVIIDEIHYFIGTDRGQHVRSLLGRLRQAVGRPFRWFGLSATMGGDGRAVKHFLGDDDNTTVLVDSSRRPTNVEFHYFPMVEKGVIPEEAYECVSSLIRGKHAMVYPNSRNAVEDIAVKMKELGHPNVFAHHSSVSKDGREAAEAFARETEDQDMAIVCTSTCELGLDIPGIEQVVQFNAVPGVSSLVQRAGRSGRRTGEANIAFVNTDPWSLLQNLASWNLSSEGTVEAPDMDVRWYKVLAHQILSVVKEKKEIRRADLQDRILTNPAFADCLPEEVASVIEKYLRDGILQELDGSLIIGTEGEKYVGRRDSYVVFDAPRNYRVICENHLVGEFEPNFELKVGACLNLSARAWEVTGIDRDKHVVHVKESAGGKKPRYTSRGVLVCPEVECEMRRILVSGERSDYLEGAAQKAVEDLQSAFSPLARVGRAGVPCYISEANQFCFYPLSGTKVFNTLALLLNASGEGFRLSVNLSPEEMRGKCEQIVTGKPELAAIIRNQLERGEIEMTSRYGKLLPVELQAGMEASRSFDLGATIAFLEAFLDGGDFGSVPRLDKAPGLDMMPLRKSGPSRTASTGGDTEYAGSTSGKEEDMGQDSLSISGTEDVDAEEAQ